MSKLKWSRNKFIEVISEMVDYTIEGINAHYADLPPDEASLRGEDVREILAFTIACFAVQRLHVKGGVTTTEVMDALNLDADMSATKMKLCIEEWYDELTKAKT